MFPQRRLFLERFRADMTRVSLIARVYDHVRVQSRLLPERHVAHIARKWFLTGVY